MSTAAGKGLSFFSGVSSSPLLFPSCICLDLSSITRRRNTTKWSCREMNNKRRSKPWFLDLFALGVGNLASSLLLISLTEKIRFFLKCCQGSKIKTRIFTAKSRSRQECSQKLHRNQRRLQNKAACVCHVTRLTGQSWRRDSRDKINKLLKQEQPPLRQSQETGRKTDDKSSFGTNEARLNEEAVKQFH